MESNDLRQTTLERAAKSGAVGVGPRCDPELARVVEAWPDLPEAIRRAVLTLVDSAG
jgi:hypothetical protein